MGDIPTDPQTASLSPASVGVIDQLRKVFRECFGDSFDSFPRSLAPRDVRKWDSTRNVELILKVEEAFGIEFSPSELARMQNVGAICDVIEARQRNVT